MTGGPYELAVVTRLDAAHGVLCEAALWPGDPRGELVVYGLVTGDILGAQPFRPARLKVPWWRLPWLVALAAGYPPG